MITAFLFLFAAIVNRPVNPAHSGPNRLDPDVELLGHARPDLADVRIIDAAGHELPYLLIQPQTGEPHWTSARVLPVSPTKKTSGFEADLGAARTIDRIRIEGVRRPFLKRARLEGSGDRAHWTLLAPDVTVFDLPYEKLRNIEIAFEPSDYRYLRVTWDDRTSAVVGAVGEVSARLHDAETPPEPTRVALKFRKVASEPQKSRYRVTMPGLGLPAVAIEAAVTNGEVFRIASVYEARLGSGQLTPQLLGTSTLKRAERYGGVAADMAVPIERPTGVDLEVVVDDGNNPPLALTAINAKLAPLPWIWFESEDGSPVTVRYGDPNAKAPRYDIEVSRATIAKSKPPVAHFGTLSFSSEAPSAETTTMAAFRGAAVDRNDFRYARALAPAPAGVARLVLDVDVLARSRGVADVRVVHVNNQQVPYIIENCAAPLTIKLPIPERAVERKSSRYAFDLQYDTLPAGSRIVFTTSAHVFERNVTLRDSADERRGREKVLTTWRSTEPDLAAPPLAFGLLDTKRVELLIDEGDNAPLPITSATVEIPSVALRFYNSGSPLTLLYGNANASAPQYDLAILAPRLVGEPAHDITLGAFTAKAPEQAAVDAKIFWAALAVATIVLLTVLARLVKSR